MKYFINNLLRYLARALEIYMINIYIIEILYYKVKFVNIVHT